MSDRLLRDLGDLARSEAEAEEARFDDRWDRLAAGTLTAEEEAELKAFAESSPEAHEMYEAFRPLGADFQARVLSAIHAQRLQETTQPTPPEPLPPVLPFRRVVRRVEVWLGTAAAVAASVFFMLRTPPPLSSGYEASLEGGFKVERGTAPSTEQSRIFGPGSLLRLEVSPKQPLKGPGDVMPGVFLSSSAGEESLSPLEPKARFKVERGSVALDATIGKDIHIPSGDWILWTVVARPGCMPKAGEVQGRLRPKRLRHDPWKAVCDALTAEQSPPPAQWQVACTPSFRVEGQTPE